MSEIELPNPDELEEHKKDRFSKRVALTTALFAVVLAITSLGGNNAMKELLLTQQQASDQWAYYQSKVMREHLYRVETLKAQQELAGDVTGKARIMLEENARLFAAEGGRYGEEKKELEKKALQLEHHRDVAQSRDPYFDYAEVLLQIAIVLASISILSGSRPVLVISVVSAVIGAILCFNGFTLLFRIPFLH